MQLKRIVTYLLAAAIIMGLFPAFTMPASAATSETTGDCTWTLDGTVLTISGNGAMKDYEDSPWEWGQDEVERITEVIIESGVTHIGDSAFENLVNLTSVTISDSVTSIGGSAFRSCWKLKNIVIPNSVTSIGYSALSQTGLTSITVPGSIDIISHAAFGHNFDLTNVTISKGVTSIDSFVFYYCENLLSITIPDSVTSIGQSAFENCKGLPSITIPDSVTYIGKEAFICCHSLEEIVFEGDAPTFEGEIMPYRWGGSWSNCSDCDRAYGEGKIRLMKVYYPANNPTWTEEVMQKCIGLNPTLNVIWVPYEIEEEEGAVAEWNVSLEDDLKVNFYLDPEIAETAEVTVTVGDTANTCKLSELEKDESGRYIASVNVAAAQMTENITVQVDDMEPVIYTVRQYCDTILRDKSYSRYHQLIKEMLNYGAMAQIYFDHNTENLANDGITGVAAAEVPETTAEPTVESELDDLYFYGASLVFRDKIAVRYYFEGYANGCSFNAEDRYCHFGPAVSGECIEVPDILPQDLDQQITMIVTDMEGKTLTVTYGPMNYIVRMHKKGNESMKNLLKALYNYHLAAKALRTETVS